MGCAAHTPANLVQISGPTTTTAATPHPPPGCSRITHNKRHPMMYTIQELTRDEDGAPTERIVFANDMPRNDTFKYCVCAQ